MIPSPSTPNRPRASWIPALALAVAAWGVLAGPAAAARATMTVTTTKDELVSHDGRCSLREAIVAVDAPRTRTDCGTAGRTADTIVLRPGRYGLSIPPAGRDDNASGDLTVTSKAPLTITGAGLRATVIDARMLGDRALSVPGGARLTLARLSITGGHPPDGQAGSSGAAGGACTTGGGGADGGGAGNGGAILNQGRLVLDTVGVTGNTAGAGGAGGRAGGNGCSGGNGGHGGGGGGVYNQGTLAVIDSTVSGNQAGAGGAGGAGATNPLGSSGAGGSGGPGGSGGGIDNQGHLMVSASAITGNRAGAGGSGGQGGAASSGADSAGGQSGAGSPGADGAGGQGASAGGIFSTAGSLTLSNSTLFDNVAGAGGAGGGLTGRGGAGGSGGAIAVVAGPSVVRNATVTDNGVGTGGVPGAAAGTHGDRGLGGGVSVRSSVAADDMVLQNTIVASNVGSGCAGSRGAAIANGGHDLSYGDATCPGRHGNPEFRPLKDNGGSTETMAIGPGSPAIDAIPRRTGNCPATDQRGVSRPQGRACDIGAFEFATPQITMIAPFQGASYERGSRILTRFACDEGGVASTIATCTASIASGRPIGTARLGTVRFVVTAIDKSGNRTSRSVQYDVWIYVNPVREVSGLTSRRIDLGVDYAGSGPLLALGRALVTTASDTDSGPSSCWAISCWPGGGIVVLRLLDGPFAGKYMYVAEHITVSVRAGQTVEAGQRIGTLYAGYPWSEWGWAAGSGPEALGIADGHQCSSCSDIGDWSTIEGRNMNTLLTRLGAPSGLLQATPSQSMPRGWPTYQP